MCNKIWAGLLQVIVCHTAIWNIYGLQPHVDHLDMYTQALDCQFGLRPHNQKDRGTALSP
jgi:hypothetical protein